MSFSIGALNFQLLPSKFADRGQAWNVEVEMRNYTPTLISMEFRGTALARYRWNIGLPRASSLREKTNMLPALVSLLLDTSSYPTCERLTALILICFRRFGYNSVVHQNFSILHWVSRSLSWPFPSDVSLLILLLWKNATRRRIAASEGWMIQYGSRMFTIHLMLHVDWRCVVSFLNKNWNLSGLLWFLDFSAEIKIAYVRTE